MDVIDFHSDISDEPHRLEGRAKFAALLAACLISIIFAAGSAASETRFAGADWDPKLFARLIGGPDLLSKDLAIAIDPHPADASAQTRREIDALIRLQASARDEATLDKIRIEADPDLGAADVFALHGLIPDAERAPDLHRALEMAEGETAWFTLREKWARQRARPSTLSAEIVPAIPVPGHASYPSGHAAQSMAVALTLSRLAPGCSAAWVEQARRIAERREIAGLHYASDSAAGRELAVIVIDALLATDDFAARLEAARLDMSPGLDGAESCPTAK